MFLEAKENSKHTQLKDIRRGEHSVFLTSFLTTFKSVSVSSSFPHLIRADQRADSLQETCITCSFLHKHNRKIMGKADGKQVSGFFWYLNLSFLSSTAFRSLLLL